MLAFFRAEESGTGDGNRPPVTNGLEKNHIVFKSLKVIEMTVLLQEGLAEGLSDRSCDLGIDREFGGFNSPIFKIGISEAEGAPWLAYQAGDAR